MKYILLPGDLVADLAGLPAESEHRQILRMYVNTVLWGALGVAGAFLALL